ncbi:MAG: hypothetical protein O2901_16165, partial [Verrucomicrobia bacterium]|nr:hypothetical protein [Verrucomicrobiota bacterium]
HQVCVIPHDLYTQGDAWTLNDMSSHLFWRNGMFADPNKLCAYYTHCAIRNDGISQCGIR